MEKLRVLVGCEESATVREAMIAVGCDAWSCDLIPSRIPGNHYQCSVFDVIDKGWDMAIFFPPCTHLCVSGARWFKNKQKEQEEALAFVRALMDCGIPRIAIENPVGIISTRIRKADQYVQPWQFGHGETKKTGLWLKNLPKLQPTNIVSGREQRIWKMGPSPERAAERSKTFQGIADAMAYQWGRLPKQQSPQLECCGLV